MGAPHLGGVDIGKAVRPELVISLAINRARHNYARIAGGSYALQVFAGIRGIADESQLQAGLGPFKGLANQKSVVLRLHAADIKKVFVFFKSQAG